MKFKFRKISHDLLEAIVEADGTSIDLGILNQRERLALVDELQEAIDRLLHGLEMQE